MHISERGLADLIADEGEVLVIAVRVPVDALTEVVFPNVRGGVVRGTFASGERESGEKS